MKSFHLSHLERLYVTFLILIINILYILAIELVEPTSAAVSSTDGEPLLIVHYINT